jgi:hypothetical protein
LVCNGVHYLWRNRYCTDVHIHDRAIARRLFASDNLTARFNGAVKQWSA